MLLCVSAPVISTSCFCVPVGLWLACDGACVRGCAADEPVRDSAACSTPTCACVSFAAHAFKKHVCANCFHDHTAVV